MTFFNEDWCGLAWTAWLPFTNPTTFRQLPTTPGLYRIRAIGINELIWRRSDLLLRIVRDKKRACAQAPFTLI
ncbi:hypothetical protein KSF_066170 [Reticulibacter mediterranei]|uniref:Uncharacterized protein n=1 Tax=Reticulibacter mediterranei TaxID=2778369 RepID=A0A8J3IJ99_9CHLR|nr:hypothetical protein KSF_066170 [Reticulibacter mediterranei]